MHSQGHFTKRGPSSNKTSRYEHLSRGGCLLSSPWLSRPMPCTLACQSRAARPQVNDRDARQSLRRQIETPHAYSLLLLWAALLIDLLLMAPLTHMALALHQMMCFLISVKLPRTKLTFASTTFPGGRRAGGASCPQSQAWFLKGRAAWASSPAFTGCIGISSFSFNEGQVTEMMLNPSTDILQVGMHSAPQPGINMTSPTLSHLGCWCWSGTSTWNTQLSAKMPGFLLWAPLPTQTWTSQMFKQNVDTHIWQKQLNRPQNHKFPSSGGGHLISTRWYFGTRSWPGKCRQGH